MAWEGFVDLLIRGDVKMKNVVSASVAVGAVLTFHAASAFAGCDVVPATSQASQVSASVTAGLIAQRVNTAATAAVGGTGATTSSGGGAGRGGSSSPQGQANIGVTSTSGCSSSSGNVVALGENDSSTPRQGAEAARSSGDKLNAVWFASSVTWLNKKDTNGDYGGSISNAVVGYDRRLSESWIGGVALGFEKVLLNTKYVANGGSVEGDTFSIAPYAGYIITDWLVADATAGYARILYRFKTAATEVGDATANRLFGSTNLTAFERIGDTLLKASLGYLRIAEFQGSYTSNQNTFNRASLANFGQVNATVGAGHDLKTTYGMFTPNAFVRYEYDVPHSAKVDLASGYRSTNDRDGVVFGLGMDYAVDDLKFNLVATTTQFRTNTEMYGVAANVRYSF